MPRQTDRRLVALRYLLCALCLVVACGEDPGAGDAAIQAADLTSDQPDLSSPRCGDGVVAGREECDRGDNRTGSGCEPTCMFTCTHGMTDGRCDDHDPCN